MCLMLCQVVVTKLTRVGQMWSKMVQHGLKNSARKPMDPNALRKISCNFEIEGP